MDGEEVALNRGSTRRPILVTGVPRSGTTWLARLLATAPGTVLAGREPMNPRGRQYALGHTLNGWTRISQPTAKQSRILKFAYRGLNPWVYSRYGRRQWGGPLPWTRIVMKDPFALLSLPVVTSVTGAIPVVIYRHPGAVLSSYRRMGWKPDLGEVQSLVRSHYVQNPQDPLVPSTISAVCEAKSAEAMGFFWSGLYALALTDLDDVPDAVIISHEELATGGPEAARTLMSRLGLTWNDEVAAQFSRKPESAPALAANLHNFDRAPAKVAAEWRSKLREDEIAAIEEASKKVRLQLEDKRLRLTPQTP